jgi:Zn finger protein HypA/HybF involved in hydrogenase expression
MTLQPGGKFILEYANKKNLKAILRYLLRRQTWNPFTLDQVEFAPLNFDFHPRMIKQWLGEEGFSIDSELTVSHFRVAIFKKTIPVGILTALDSVLQWTAPILKFSPSIFLRAHTIAGEKSPIPLNPQDFFRCILCGEAPLIKEDEKIVCPACGSNWRVVDGIYDFRKEDA